MDVNDRGIIMWDGFLAYLIQQSASMSKEKILLDFYRERKDYELHNGTHKDVVHKVSKIVWYSHIPQRRKCLFVMLIYFVLHVLYLHRCGGSLDGIGYLSV